MKKYFPTDRYRKREGVFEVATFESEPIPEGWLDTPALCEGYVHGVSPLVRVSRETVRVEIERAIRAEIVALAAAEAAASVEEPDRPRRGRPRIR